VVATLGMASGRLGYLDRVKGGRPAVTRRDDSRRHQWGPAPSGETRHVSVCRRCGLQEIADWYEAPSGRPVEVIQWVTPTGAVLAMQPLDSHQDPPSVQRGGVLAYAVVAPVTVEAIRRCPGDPEAWSS